jgi:hypothetical protein
MFLTNKLRKYILKRDNTLKIPVATILQVQRSTKAKKKKYLRLINRKEKPNNLSKMGLMHLKALIFRRAEKFDNFFTTLYFNRELMLCSVYFPFKKITENLLIVKASNFFNT